MKAGSLGGRAARGTMWIALSCAGALLAAAADARESAAKPDAARGATAFASYITAGLSSPIGITHAGDGSQRLFIIQQGGAVRVVVNDVLQASAYLTLSSATQCRATPASLPTTVGFTSGGERGLLGLAFHPQFASNGRVFVSFTDVNGDTYIARFTASDPAANVLSAADLQTCLTLLRVDQDFSNHNGGNLAFGHDGYLYLGLGDGGSGNDPCNRAQTLNPASLNNAGSCAVDAAFTNSGGNPDSRALLGKLLRLDVDGSSAAGGTGNRCGAAVGGAANYAIPVDNPFAGNDAASGCDEVWDYGLRNPWRFSFDRMTGDLFIGDVGQGAREEVNFETPTSGARNYGWRCVEGNLVTGLCAQVPPDAVAPIIVYNRVSPHCSVTGGYRYRGPVLNVQGHYFFGDYCSRQIWNSTFNAGNWTQPGAPFQTLPGSLTSFGEDERCNLYATSGSEIWRLQGTTGPNQPPVLDTPIPDRGDAEGDPIAFGVSTHFSDADCGTLSFSATGLPPGVSVNSAGFVSGALGFDAAGSYTVTVTASDGQASVQDQFAWDVADTNRPPIVVSPIPDQASDPGDAISFDVSGSFSDPDDDPLQFSANGLPPGLSISTTGLISGTLSLDSAGSYAVTVTASDVESSVDDGFDWHVANQPPVVVTPIADQVNDAGDDVLLDIAGHFDDPDGDPLQFSATGLPPGLSISSAGVISGTLAAGSAGLYAVTVIANDGKATVQDSFSWSVNNRPPVLLSPIADQFSDAGDTVNLDVVGHFDDPDGDKLTFDANGLPPGLSISGSGVISGTILLGASGTYSVTVTASDGDGSVQAVFAWEVAVSELFIFGDGFESCEPCAK